MWVLSSHPKKKTNKTNQKKNKRVFQMQEKLVKGNKISRIVKSNFFICCLAFLRPL